MRSLFSAALANFDLAAFDEHLVLGGLLLGFYLLMAHVMLLNLLIALLSNVYSDLILRVDSEHRAVVIAYYNRWHWDDQYGVLIFAPSPLSFLILITSSLVLFTKDKHKRINYNMMLTKIFYVFYAIPQYLIFLIGSLMYLPLLYIKGFAIYGKTQQRRRDNKVESIEALKDTVKEEEKPIVIGYSWWKGFKWSILGIPWLICSIVRDSVDFWKIMHDKADDISDEEKTKV